MWTRKIRSLLAAVLLVGPSAAHAHGTATLEAFADESRTAVKAFAEDLKAELLAAIKERGAVSAIPVCSARAPEIARQASAAYELSIGRTSLRVRNPANAPDPWEARILDRFAARAEAGEDMAGMEAVEIAEKDGRPHLRYMKAIPVQEVCLTCHGSAIAPAVLEQIDAFYPDDQATGFALGDLRGAFTVSRPLDAAPSED
jgi:hypothetical protein